MPSEIPSFLFLFQITAKPTVYGDFALQKPVILPIWKR